ncbi:MAG: hypothetical protein M1821_005014 [Bathelium mastoideum]|nr:MAG: hypothetical protein M1821_005014 [Bathelium mastoideum]
MWTIECDGPHLDGKRLWLRPDSSTIFGRTSSKDTNTHVIDSKSVSRKHLVIHVGPINPGDGSRIYNKSKVTLEDLSKIGTWLDGVKFAKERRTLDKIEHEYRLGSYPCVFKIKWNPVVLSFTFPNKRAGSDEDAIAPYQYRLEPLDVKAVHDYVTGETTHVVAAKRNTARGLQALVNAKPIVTEAFVDALVAAATPVPNPDDPSAPLPSLLEQDFDANWPDAAPYLPDESKEPVPRPSEAFNPKPERDEVFAGFTFVFLDSAQFGLLQAPINDGHGKALLYELVPGESTVDQVIEYVTNVSGYKTIDELQSANQQRKGAVIVRTRPRGKWHDWTENFQLRLDVKLGLRSLEQNEFLEIILQNDTSSLIRPLEEGEESENQSAERTTSAGAAKPSAEATLDATRSNNSHNTTKHDQIPLEERDEPPLSPAPEQNQPGQPQEEDTKASEPARSGPMRRRGRRGVITSRFTGFDDFDASSSAQAPTIPEETEPSQAPLSGPARSTRSQVSAPPISEPQPAATQKRSLSPSPDREAAVESLLPGAAAMKRRRLERGTPGPETGDKRKASNEIKEEPGSSKKSKIKVEDVDYNALLRSRREAEDEAARQDQEALKQALAIEGLSAEDMKNLVKVEEVDVPLRSRSFNESQGEKTQGVQRKGRWDERWNGRRNFKGFKKREHDGEVPQRRQRVIVSMEEVKKKSFGLGEEYWNEIPEPNQNRRDTQSQSRRRPSQRETQARDEDDPNKFRRRKDAGRPVDAEIEVEPEEIIQPTRDESLQRRVEERARERGMAGIDEDSSTQHPTQTSRAETQTQKSKGKRPARDEPEAAPQPKRQTRLDSGRRAAPQEEDGDSLKFKFRRRKKD